eukprot:7384647-Lingulodinium_polyedra.AAC.1
MCIRDRRSPSGRPVALGPTPQPSTQPSMPPAGGDANLGPSATSASSYVCMLSPPAQRVPESQ